MLKEMDDYTDQILAYNQGKSSQADQGFERKAFDVFVKTIKANFKGVPLDQNYIDTYPNQYQRHMLNLMENVQFETRRPKNFSEKISRH